MNLEKVEIKAGFSGLSRTILKIGVKRVLNSLARLNNADWAECHGGKFELSCLGLSARVDCIPRRSVCARRFRWPPAQINTVVDLYASVIES